MCLLRRKWFWVLVNFLWELKRNQTDRFDLKPNRTAPEVFRSDSLHTVGQVVWKVTNEDDEICVLGRQNLRPVDKTTPHLKGDCVILSFKNRHAAVRTGQKHTFWLNHLYRCNSVQNGFDNISRPQNTDTKTTLRSRNHYQCQVHEVDVCEATKHIGQKAQRDPVKTFYPLGKSPGDTRS